MNKKIASSFFIFFTGLYACFAIGDEIRSPNVHGIKFFRTGDQLSMPIMTLGGIGQLELHFDDFQTSSKNYYYTYELCNADWTSANLSQMDYITGFSQNRINQYRFSSVAITRYVHYQIRLPTTDCMPSKSGNYILKVFSNGDTSKLLFSRRMMVVDNKIGVAAQIQPPFSPEFYRTHQKIVAKVNLKQLDIFNPQQQVKIAVLQNHRWDNAQYASSPTFIRGTEFEYNSENNFIFEGGKEWRWLDLRSFKLYSDRVRSVDYVKGKSYDIYPVPDSARSPVRYLFYKDYNGYYYIENMDDLNPWWQSDYATVHFTFLPTGQDDFRKKQIFLIGELTGYNTSPDSAMQWNEEIRAYEKDVLLKNGYYSYCYQTKDATNPNASPSFRYTEGTLWDTENQYTILVYYRSFAGRSDELLGYTELNSLSFLTQQPNQ